MQPHLVDHILASKKYRALYRSTVERVVENCLGKYGPERAEDEARTILHQIWGSYYGVRPDFKKLWEKFQAEVAGGRREEAIDMVLRLHASSAERLPIFDEFYEKIFAIILRDTQDRPAQPLSIVDHGCCLDPIAFERMASLFPCHPELGEGPSTFYQAFEIDTEEIDFLQKACALLGYGEKVRVACGDAISDQAVEADIVFMLKLLPVLEQQEKGSARAIIMKQQCKWLVISYPVASLSGKEKGMTEFYTKQFEELTTGLNWKIERLLFATELVFICKR